MYNANGKTIIQRFAKYADALDYQLESTRIFTLNCRLFYLLLIPSSVAAVFFTVFFLSVFFLILGLWIGWLRRKLRNSYRSEGLEGEYFVIKETQHC